MDQLFVSTVHNFMPSFLEIWIVSFSLVSMTTRRSAMVKQSRSEPWTMSSTRGCASLISRERNGRGPLPHTVRRGERKKMLFYSSGPGLTGAVDPKKFPPMTESHDVYSWLWST
jgi:hypothetical protein